MRDLIVALERPSSELEIPILAQKRVLVVGLGPVAECVIGFSEKRLGAGEGGFLRLVGLPGEHVTGLELGRWLAGNLPSLQYQETTTPESLENELERCEMVVDAGHFLDAGQKCHLYRAARRRNKPVVSAYPTGTGATAYYFHPENSTTFEEVFSVPPEALRVGWKLPLRRLVLQDDAENQFRLFQLLNGLHPVRLNPLSVEAVRMMVQQLVISGLQGHLVPQAPVACYLEPQQYNMGTVHLGRRMAEQSASIWTQTAALCDELLLDRRDSDYRQLAGRIHADLSGCRRILEGGCLTGNISQGLALAGVESYAIERNLALLARASHKAAHTPNMFVGEGDVQKLYFPDEYFEGYCSHNAVFDADTVLALQEAYRVLKPGGRLALAASELLPESEEDWAARCTLARLQPGAARAFLAAQREAGAARELKLGGLNDERARLYRLLREIGFTSVEVSQTSPVSSSLYLLAQK